MRRNYHDKLLEKFCEEIHLFKETLGFIPTAIEKNKSLKWKGEIDILLFSKDNRALVEVKSHSGLIRKFTEKQFPIYHEYDPKASIYLLLGNKEESLNPIDFHLKKYHPI